jgi:sugar lactone lactonase YvrE
MTDVHIAFDAGNHLGETPIWSVEEQALWWINCEHPAELYRWHPESGAHRCWPMPKRIGGFVPKASGGLLVALADGVYDFIPASGLLSLRAASPFPPHVNLHECHCDRHGRFWIGGFDTRYPADRTAADAGYCRLDSDRLTIVVTGVHVANGLAFSPDGRTMYAVTTPTRQVDAFDLDPATGALSNRRPFVTLGEGEGFADGATVDSEGGYWMANVAAGALRRYWPEGTFDRLVALPFANPTKPAFGGPDLKRLYVTTTQMAMPPANFAGSMPNGPVYVLEPGETGVPEVPFAG